MAWHKQGRARISVTSPRAIAACDRCGFTYGLSDLHWQYQWAGTQIQNLKILVCDQCLDKPQSQLRTIILPPDPMPVMNPRPEPYSSEVPSYRFTEGLSGRRVTEDGQPRVTEGIPPNG